MKSMTIRLRTVCAMVAAFAALFAWIGNIYRSEILHINKLLNYHQSESLLYKSIVVELVDKANACKDKDPTAARGHLRFAGSMRQTVGFHEFWALHTADRLEDTRRSAYFWFLRGAANPSTALTIPEPPDDYGKPPVIIRQKPFIMPD